MTEAKGRERAEDLRSSISDVTQRIDEIITVAEQAADRARTEASAEGKRYLDRRREEADRAAKEHAATLREVTQKVIRHAEQVGGSAEALTAELRTVLPKLRALANDQGRGAGASSSKEAAAEDAASGESEQER